MRILLGKTDKNKIFLEKNDNKNLVCLFPKCILVGKITK